MPSLHICHRARVGSSLLSAKRSPTARAGAWIAGNALPPVPIHSAALRLAARRIEADGRPSPARTNTHTVQTESLFLNRPHCARIHHPLDPMSSWENFRGYHPKIHHPLRMILWFQWMFSPPPGVSDPASNKSTRRLWLALLFMYTVSGPRFCV